jgi:hypothetical protein
LGPSIFCAALGTQVIAAPTSWADRLIAAGISLAIISVLQGLGTKLKATFSAVSTAL